MITQSKIESLETRDSMIFLRGFFVCGLGNQPKNGGSLVEKFCESGNITFSVCHITSCNHMIKGIDDLVSGNHSA